MNYNQIVEIFLCHYHLPGTLFFSSADEKGMSYLALFPIRQLKSKCWIEVEAFVQSSRLPIFGYFPYEMEQRECTLFEPSLLIQYDHGRKRITYYGKWQEQLRPDHSLAWKAGYQTRSDSQKSYCDKIVEVLELIKAGEVYQVNLSQEFTFSFTGNPAYFWLQIMQKLLPSHGAFLNLGGKQILSFSPELFIVQKGMQIKMAPIKGTQSREKPLEDLLNSEKNLAELTMIIDLYRNDLSKTAQKCSVKVPRGVEVLINRDLYHLYGTVYSKLKSKISSVDLLESVFPAGSITGCPKEASMGVISNLEKSGRDAYTGAIGWIDSKNRMEMSVAIRTMILENEELTFRLGGGIVADSDPASEYKETLLKGRTFFETLGVDWRAL